MLSESWATFEARVIHSDSGVVHKREMKMAFYAGAWAALNDADDDREALAAECQRQKDEYLQYREAYDQRN